MIEVPLYSSPLSNEYGTHQTVKVIFWAWLPGEVSRGDKMAL